MKKQLLFTLLLSFFLCGNAYSQNQINNWFFGDSLMMHFDDGLITTDKLFSENLITGCEASASISDSVGNLLFYTDGKYVWNKENNEMENGNSLLIDQYLGYAGSSITQGIIIIPAPEHPNRYFIFYIGNANFYYSTIDMVANEGLGKVVEDEKNINLIPDVTLFEKMHAIKHANGRDWWLVLHEYKSYITHDSTNLFFRFLITPDGVSGPFNQNIGTKWDDVAGWGQMLFSPGGDKLVFPQNNYLELFDFDRCEGLLSNPLKVEIDNSYDSLFEEYTYSCYGLSFSPDGSKLYVSNPLKNSKLYQYCFNCEIPFLDSRKLIYELSGNQYVIGQHQLCSDGKIYIAMPFNTEDFNTVFTSKNMNLCVINNPNLEGETCNFDTSSVWLGGRRCMGGLPNFANYSLGPLTGSGCDTITAINPPALTKNNITLYPNPAKETITIISHLANFTNTSLQIFAVTGEKLKEEKITAPSQKINIAALPQGMYTVVVKDENGYLYSDKLIITQ